MRVLIVDDSRVARLLVCGYLEERRPDWQLDQASSGVEALTLATEHAYDLVVLDINMPGMSGLLAGERILRASASIRVAVLTGNVQTASRLRAEALGMLFLAKPVNDALIERLLTFAEQPE
ncbi:response regulator [Chitinimonas lacunae]|uniref:Response regulator n=1 Tax=Chitinimonas lacunae TaxID=1963018 RepID=A0ABV8MW89_9NEIS